MTITRLAWIVTVLISLLTALLLLLSGYFVPLALILLAAELYNILAFHLMFQSGSGIGPGLLACVLWVLVCLQYRANFNSILTPKPASQPWA